MNVFNLKRFIKKLKRASAPDSLHKSSHSTVQGAATGDGLHTEIMSDAFVYVNQAAQLLSQVEVHQNRYFRQRCRRRHPYRNGLTRPGESH